MSKMGIDRDLKRWENSKSGLMGILVKNSAGFFNSNFTKQGFRARNRVVKWDKLKKARKDGTRTPILIDTGALRANVKTAVLTANLGMVEYLQFYGAYQNYGNPRTNLVARQFLGESGKLNDQNKKRIESYIKRKFRR